VANHLKADKRLQILHLLVEGNSIRSTARLTGSRIRTILSHPLSAREQCRKLMDHSMRNLQLDHLELDEIWTRRRIRGVENLPTRCTSHVERNNGTIRQWCKRFTRLTYAFSKKRVNLWAAISLHVAYDNFCRRHSNLRITPAMAAGVTNRLWSFEDLREGGLP
jgi:hypothetical protein